MKKEDLREFRMMDFNAPENDENKMIVEGYAAVFNQETLIGDEEYGFYEKIDTHAFDGCDMRDCCLKYNHGDSKGILARVRNGSLQLSTDDYGLKIRAELIDTTDNVDIYKCIKARLLDKMSFCFSVEKQEYDETRRPALRTILKVGKLVDVAVVDIPAYSGSEIYARSKAILDRGLENKSSKVDTDEAVLDNAEKRQYDLELAKLKLRLLRGGQD